MENINILQTTFIHLSIVLCSENVSRDVTWYHEKLGFENANDSSNYQEGEVDYAFLGRQNLYVHLQFQFPKDLYVTDNKFQVQMSH